MKLFNKGLYIEGFRKNMLIGLIFIVVFTVLGVFIPLSMASEASSVYAGSIITKTIYNGSNMIYLALCFGAMAPLLALNTFNFLNKRNSSDFYHSLPHKRETIFIMYSLSAVTWILIAILVPSGISLIVASFSKYLEVNLISIIYTLLNITVASFLVFSATALAICVTGTLFSNITTALLIIFMPRILLTIFKASISGIVYIMPDVSFGILGDYSFNIPFNFVAGFLNGNINILSETGLPSIIYTFILGLVYFIISGVVFKKRKSENAGYPAQNRVIQAAIRIAISFLICTFACMSIVQARGDIDGASMILLVAIYIFAVIAYFVYEAISTKGLKTLGKAVPGLVVVVLLNIAFIAGANIAIDSIFGYEWKTDNIDSISYQSHNNYMDLSYQSSYEDYKLSEIKINDSDIKDIITQILNEQRETVQKGNSIYGTNYYDEYTLKIKLKNGSSKYRTVVFNSKQYEKFIDAFEQGGYTSGEYWSLPETYTLASITMGEYSIDAKTSEAINKIYQQEIKDNNIQPKDYMTHSWLSNSDAQSERPAATIDLYGSYGTETYYSSYLISSKTPKTLQAVIDYYTSAGNYNNIIEGIDNLIKGKTDYSDDNTISLNLYEYFGMSYDVWVSNSDDIDEDMIALLKDIKQAIEDQKTKDIDFDKKVVSLSIDTYGNDSSNYACFLNIDDELEEKLISVSKKLNNYAYAS